MDRTPDQRGSAAFVANARRWNARKPAGVAGLENCPSGSGCLFGNPFPQDLGGTLFADFDHAPQSPFRAFFDAAVEATFAVIAKAEQVVGAVEAEVGTEAFHQRAARTAGGSRRE